MVESFPVPDEAARGVLLLDVDRLISELLQLGTTEKAASREETDDVLLDRRRQFGSPLILMLNVSVVSQKNIVHLVQQ